MAQRESNAVRVRCMIARMLGLLSCYIVKPAPGIDYSQGVESPVDCYVKVLLVHLNSKSALQRMMTALVIAEWAERDADTSICPPALRQRLHACLNECVYFDEIAVSFTRLAQETRDFVAMMKHYKVPVAVENDAVLTLEHIQQLTGNETQQVLVRFKLKPKVQESLEERRRSIQGAVSQTSSDQYMLSVSTLGECSLLFALHLFLWRSQDTCMPVWSSPKFCQIVEFKIVAAEQLFKHRALQEAARF